jgi:outer membrane biosynthesis protein TonB
MRRRRCTISVFLLAGVIAPACQKRHPNFAPPPAPQPQQNAITAPAELPQPPEVPPEPSQPVIPAPTLPPEVPPPPAPATPQPRPRRPAPSDTRTQPYPAEVPTPQQPAEPPRLSTKTTPEQERDLNTQIDQSLNNAETSLRAIQNRTLGKEQQGAVAQVRSFIRQAREMRVSDLPAARSLAQRAEILARDLASSLR